ncbi:MAG: leucine-rich repeat domain-containing protein [Bacteroidales bacterium]|nr:leucine-rich repeat domain-containing protein [Bacteroidales bacterium]
MKKFIYLLFATVLFSSCEKDELFERLNQGGTASGELPEIIYATVAGNNDETRAYTDGTTIYWNNGDAVSYYMGQNHRMQYKYYGEDGATTAEFHKVEGIPSQVGFEVSKSYAVFPYGAGGSCTKENNIEKLRLYFSENQDYAPNSFGKDANVMVAVGEHSTDTDLYFRNTCGYLVIKLYGAAGTKVETIEVTALGGEKIAGYGFIEPHYDAAPEVTMTDEGTSTIVLNCGAGVELGTSTEQATEFWFAMPPVTFEKGLKILVTPTEGGAFTMQTSKKVTITRRNIQPMAALKFTANTQSDHQLIYTRASSTEPLVFSGEITNPFDATITKHYYDKEKKHFVIEFDKPLTTIKANAFSGSKIVELIGSWYSKPSNVTDITSVIFPKSLTTIGKFAFAGTALRELTIPGNVTQVGYYAFWECRNLERVSILEGEGPLMVVANASSAARGPFGFSPLRHISINRDIDYRDYYHFDDEISEGDFYYENVDEGLFSLSADSESGANRPGTVDEVTVEIGPKLSQIYPYMFAYRNIKSINIPSNVTIVGKDAFFNCDDLETVIIPSAQTAIGEHAFCFSNKVKTVVIGSSHVAKNSFYECTGLESVTILGTVEEIENDVFYNCDNLKSLTLEPSPTGTPLTLGYQTFGTDDQSPFYDASLETLNWNRALNYALEKDGSIDAINEGLFSENPNLSNVTIGEQVTGIPHYTFAKSGLPSVSIPGSVTTIGKYAFYDCDKLESIDIPATVKTVDYGALYDCDALQKADLGASTIDAGVLYDCDALEALTIRGTVNTIGMDAFYSCGELKYVSFKPSQTGTKLIMYYQSYLSDEQVPFHDAKLELVDWNREITLHGGDASEATEGFFQDQSNLTSVTIGSQVKEIPYYTFANSGLTSITIPSSITTIGHDAFTDCNALHTVIINPSDEVLNIANQKSDYGTFYNSPLKHIELGRTTKYITQYGSLFIPDEWDEGMFANEHYKNVDEVSVTIGSNVINISEHMFNYLNIKTLTIPSSVIVINKEAFHKCEKLSTLTFESGEHKLKIGCHIGSDDVGPFYYSPLTQINVYREFELDADYEKQLDAPDMGIFSSGTSTLTSINIGGGLRNILPYMFSQTAVSNMWITNTIESIGNYAFYNCDNLNTITLGYDGLTKFPSIGTGVFDKCDKTVQIKVREGVYNDFLKKVADNDLGWGEYGNRIITGPY